MKKPITLPLPKCVKCKKTLKPEFTTEQEEGDKGKPEVLIMLGRCKKCKVITVCQIIKTKDIPTMKDLDKLKKCKCCGLVGCEEHNELNYTFKKGLKEIVPFAELDKKRWKELMNEVGDKFDGFIKNVFEDCERNLDLNKIRYAILVRIIKQRSGNGRNRK